MARRPIRTATPRADELGRAATTPRASRIALGHFDTLNKRIHAHIISALVALAERDFHQMALDLSALDALTAEVSTISASLTASITNDVASAVAAAKAASDAANATAIAAAQSTVEAGNQAALDASVAKLKTAVDTLVAAAAPPAPTAEPAPAPAA